MSTPFLAYRMPWISSILTRIKNILAHKAILIILPAVAFIISLPFLSLGWMFDDFFLRLQMRDTPAVKEYVPAQFSFNHFKGYYAFLEKNPERTAFLFDRGLIPWWANNRTSVSFWRPFTSMFLLADFTLWPDNPFAMHLHNSIWFVVLAFISLLVFRRIQKSPWIAGLAGFVFIFNSINFLPVSWISNRHMLIALVMSLVTLLFIDMHNRKNNIRYLIFSYIFFILALLASEAGIIALAYLLGYIFFLSKKPVIKRFTMFTPFLFILVLWRIIYTIQGYGVNSSGIYVDPLNNPIRFFSVLVVKIPFLCGSVLFNIPSDLYGFFSREALPFTAFLLFIVLCITGIMLKKCICKNKSLYFWAASFFFTLIPLCTTTPVDRNLMPLSFCAVGLAAEMFSCFISQYKKEKKKGYLFPALFFCLFIGLKITGGFVGMYLYPAGIKALQDSFSRSVHFGEDPDLADQDVVIVAPPMCHFYYAFSIEQLFKNMPMPRHIRVLSPAFSNSTITRLDSSRIRVAAEDGYYPPPVYQNNSRTIVSGHFHHLNPQKRMEWMYIDSSYRPETGDTIRMSNVLITITGLTEDRRIREAVFQFDVPLEHQLLRFITWDPRGQQFVPFTLPGVGETVTINGIR